VIRSSTHHFRVPPLIALVFVAVMATPARGQHPTSPDSSSAAAPAVRDSMAASAAADSLRPSLAVRDSVVTETPALRDSMDTRTPAAADSTGGDGSEVEHDSALLSDPGPLLPPWTHGAWLGPVEVEHLRPRGADDVVEALPRSSLRVAGDRGFDAFLDLGPLDGGSAEILYDGVPTRSPADLDPGVWDVTAVGTAWAQAARGEAASSLGGSAVQMERDPAVWGRTLFRTHFQRSRLETYLRGLSVTTPRAPRTLRLDYEEWKTEDGDGFSSDPNLGAIAGFGRSKMRRWVLSGAVNTGLGRWSVGFGRGRRYHDGTVAHAGAVERWTGQLWTGLDRQDGTHHLRVRLYHLDWNDVDSIHQEKRDASRLGGRLSWSAEGAGPLVQLDFERWSALFHTNLYRSQATTLVGQTRLGWRNDPTSKWSWSAQLGANWAELAQGRWAPAADARLRWRAGGSWWLGLRAGRQPRTPTLLETSGHASFDLAGGFTLHRMPHPDLLFEVHDRLRVESGLKVGSRGRLVVGAESWWLRDGIGWVPDSYTATDGKARTVGGLHYDLQQLDCELKWPMGNVHHGAQWRVQGGWVLGDLPRDASRGGGWPKSQAQLTLSWWHDLFSSYDQVRIFYRVVHAGEHYGDRVGVFSEEGDLLPYTTRQDLRVALKLRDAELYLEVHNFMDAHLQEVAGTRRRNRDLQWGLSWPFWN